MDEANPFFDAFLNQEDTDEETNWVEEVEAKRKQLVTVPEPDEDGNFDTPMLRTVFGGWDWYDEGHLSPRELCSVLEGMKKELSLRVRYLSSAVLEGSAEPGNPVHRWTVQGLETQIRGLDTMIGFFQEGEEELVEDGLELFSKGCNQMMQAFVEFQGQRMEQLLFACPGCGHKNPKGETVCSNCGAKLPQVIAREGGIPIASMDQVTSNYRDLERRVQSWIGGKTSPAELGRAVATVSERLHAHLRAHRSLHSELQQLTGKEREWFRGLYDQTASALGTHIQALEDLSFAVQSQDPARVEQGLAQFRDSSRQLARAYGAHEAALSAASSL